MLFRMLISFNWPFIPCLWVSLHIHCIQQSSPSGWALWAMFGGQGKLTGGVSSMGGQRFSQVTFPFTQTHLAPQGSMSEGMSSKLLNFLPLNMQEPSAEKLISISVIYFFKTINPNVNRKSIINQSWKIDDCFFLIWKKEVKCFGFELGWLFF